MSESERTTKRWGEDKGEGYVSTGINNGVRTPPY